MRLFVYFFLCFLLLGIPEHLFAATEPKHETVQKQAIADQVIAALSDRSTLDEIAQMRDKIQKMNTEAQAKVTLLESELNRLKLAMGDVGSAAKSATSTEGEAQDLPIDKMVSSKEEEIASYKLLILTYQNILLQLEEARKKRLARNLIYRGEDLLTIGQLVSSPGNAIDWQNSFHWHKSSLSEEEIKQLVPSIWLVFPAILIFALVIFKQFHLPYSFILQFAGKRNLLYYIDLFLLKKSGVIRLFAGCITFLVLVFWLYPTDTLISIVAGWVWLFVYFLTITPLCARALLYRIVIAKVPEYVPFTRKELFLFWSVFGFFLALLMLSFSQVLSLLLLPNIYFILRFTVLLLSCASLVLTFRILRHKYPTSFACKMLFGLSLLGSLFFLLLESLGYRNLVDYLLQGVGKSLILFGMLIAANDAIDLLMDIGRKYREKLLNLLLKTDDEEYFDQGSSGSGLVNFALKLLLYIGFLYFFVYLWGGIAVGPNPLDQLFSDGFHLGDFTFSPGRIVVAIVVLLIGWSGVYFLKRALDTYWLSYSRISRNSKETILTLVGYLAYALLILVGLQVAGFQLTGLSLILGAFSVGIGFGLQNIVNNFISGLILMFEQPIKKGNWVKVGDEQGYVKKISIRSTVIQTFDRSDVIVPNSELISSQVTNMMLNDTYGRLKIRIGVAYGSDTKLVQDLLLKIASEHKEVIQVPRNLPPRVYFEEFGDSSLNFMLSCYLIDVNNVLNVRSEINFEIDRLFREHGIEIPFPQRDVHIKNGIPPESKESA